MPSTLLAAELGRDAHPGALDVRDPGAWERAVELGQSVGDLAALVNCAARTDVRDLFEIEPERVGRRARDEPARPVPRDPRRRPAPARPRRRADREHRLGLGVSGPRRHGRALRDLEGGAARAHPPGGRSPRRRRGDRERGRARDDRRRDRARARRRPGSTSSQPRSRPAASGGRRRSPRSSPGSSPTRPPTSPARRSWPTAAPRSRGSTPSGRAATGAGSREQVAAA